MKKNMIIIFGIILMFGIATAINFNISKDVSIDLEYKDKINAINEDIIERGDIICDNLDNELTGNELCLQKMWKGDYNLGEVKVQATKCETYNVTFNNKTQKVDRNDINNITFNNKTQRVDKKCIKWIILSDTEILKQITKHQENKLEEIAKVISQRESEIKKKKIVDSGEIILKVREGKQWKKQTD